MASTSGGEKFRARGYRPNHPIIIVPGLCCSVLEVVESPYEQWIGKRIWLDMSMIGLDKVLDSIPLFGAGGLRKWTKKKPPKSPRLSKREGSIKRDGPLNISSPMNTSHTTGFSTPELERREMLSIPLFREDVTQDITGEEVHMANVDEDVKRRWIQHMVLGPDNIADPEGIKVRPVKGIAGCAYLDPRLKAFSYVWGPFIEMLQAIGYNDVNLRAATYDWRLPPAQLEIRDGYFTELKTMIEDTYHDNENKKVVLMGHSLGTRCLSYFLRWAEKNLGREWISTHIHTYIAIGPLFLGAPKSVRATISGERMGLDAFLYPEEGVQLTRNVGSSPWMYPTRLKDYGLKTFTYVRNDVGEHVSLSMGDAMKVGDCSPCYDLFQEHYVDDDCIGDEDANAAPPPVDRVYAIYGVNLRTECVYFFRKSKSKKPVTTLELDPDGSLPHYKCVNGIGYETKRTPQVDGRSVSGDGTVPYASMAHCRKWQNRDDIEVRITELDKCDHRDILKDKRFVAHMVDYVCFPPPPLFLPEGFKDSEYHMRLITKATRKHTLLRFHLTRKGLEVLSRKKELKASYRYLDVDKVTRSDDPNVFSIKFEGSSSERSYKCENLDDFLTDLSARRRYVKCLLATASKTGESEEVRDSHGQTALHRAADANDIPKVRELLFGESQCDVNALDNNGWSVMHICASNGYLKLAKVILERDDVEVNLVSKDGTSPLHYFSRLAPESVSEEKLSEAVFQERLFALLRDMLEKGMNVNLQKNNGETAIHQALARGRVSMVKWLLDHKANVNSLTQAGDSPLHYAIMMRLKEVVPLLLEKGADKHKKNQEGKTPLRLAKDCDKEMFALVCGVDINQLTKMSDGQDEYGQTELHKAAFEGRTDKVFALLNTSADCNAVDKNGWTALHNASSNGHLDCILLLLGAPDLDVNIVSKNGSSVFHYLVRLNRQGVEREKCEHAWTMFISRGGDINVKNSAQETPLHLAVLRNNLHAVSWLVDNGAEVNQANKRGDTSLHYAIRSRSEPIISLLLDYDADPTMVGCEGTAYQLAENTDKALHALLLDPEPEELASRGSLGRVSAFSHKMGSRKHTTKNLKSHVKPKRSRDKRSSSSSEDDDAVQEKLAKEIKKVKESTMLRKRDRFIGLSSDGSVRVVVSANRIMVEDKTGSGTCKVASVNEALEVAMRQKQKEEGQRAEGLSSQLDMLKGLV